MSKQTKQSHMVSKAVEVMKYVINRVENPDIYKVLKIVYFADKIHLKKYAKLILPSQYIKMQNGPVHELCYEIIKFIRDGKPSSMELIDQCVKQEIELVPLKEEDENDKINYGLRSLEADCRRLSTINTECLDEAIKKYGKCDSNKLRDDSHDEIYHSVKTDIITIIDMANILDPSGELTEEVSEIYPLMAI